MTRRRSPHRQRAPGTAILVRMSRPDDQTDPRSESDIADTGMFRRFVEHEQELEAGSATGDKSRKYLIALAIIALVAVGVLVWTLTR